MSKYVCDSCGDVVDEDDLPTYEEDFGFDTGVGWKSMTQTFTDNCACGGNFVEGKKCSLCDEYYDPDKLEGGVCEYCLEQEATLENAIRFGDDNQEEIAINGYLARSFTNTQIEEILTKHLVEAQKITPAKINQEAKDYCLDDKSCFGEWLEENG